MTDNNTATISSIDMAIEIDAPKEKVWESLVDRIGEWWPAEFYSGGVDGARSFRIEATPGGRMIEEWEQGGGTLWGTVVSLDIGNSLQVVGHLFPNWGGPSQSYGTWTLSESGGKTTLSYEHAALGRVSDGGMQEQDKGWKFLWATLKAHVEGTAAPTWSD